MQDLPSIAASIREHVPLPDFLYSLDIKLGERLRITKKPSFKREYDLPIDGAKVGADIREAFHFSVAEKTCEEWIGSSAMKDLRIEFSWSTHLWNAHFTFEDGDRVIGVEVDLESGRPSRVSRPRILSKPIESRLSDEDLLGKAKSRVGRTDAPEVSDREKMISFTWPRSHNGLPVEGDCLRVDLHPTTGEAAWWDRVHTEALPDIGVDLDEAAAREALVSHLKNRSFEEISSPRRGYILISEPTDYGSTEETPRKHLPGWRIHVRFGPSHHEGFCVGMDAKRTITPL